MFYAECQYDRCFCFVMLSVVVFIFVVLSVIILSVILLTAFVLSDDILSVTLLTVETSSNKLAYHARALKVL